ncbi:MAG: hypothetical protein KDH97_12210 [Calditrichaeota bacterium]|nr:hypothetical protein [Calditrichota bacterium]MCB0291011.1 hypothetical protein [Calditrichota bacterium]MCB0315193.1 hypothetical protein [Calditrichota bacterium]MCB9090369.1 hypothetical protein [Calditrichia bacterium]
MRLHNIAPILLLSCLLFWQCIERDRDNPFDPQGDQDNILNLQIFPEADRVLLQWSLEAPLTDYRGFRIYRSLDAEENFEILEETPAGQFTFTDTEVEAGRWYFYRVVAFSASEETQPSNTTRALLGPGTYWVLSPVDYCIKQLSYDAVNIRKQFRFSIAPVAWSFIPGEPRFWVAYEPFTQSIGTIRKSDGEKAFFYPDSLVAAADLAADPAGGQVYILDDRRREVVVFLNGAVLRRISLEEDQYIRLAFDHARGRLYVLGEGRLISFDPEIPAGTRQTFHFPPGFQGKDFDLRENIAYILSASENSLSSIIYTISDQVITDSLHTANYYYRIHYDEVGGQYYLAEENPGGDDLIVQLSPGGDRQIHSSGYKRIAQIAMNPFDRSVVIVDYLGSLLYLYDAGGNRISVSRAADGSELFYGPTRVYIE